MLCCPCLSSSTSSDCCLLGITTFCSSLFYKPSHLPGTNWHYEPWTFHIAFRCILFCFYLLTLILLPVLVFVNLLERSREGRGDKRTAEGNREKRGRKKLQEEVEAWGWGKEGETEGLKRKEGRVLGEGTEGGEVVREGSLESLRGRKLKESGWQGGKVGRERREGGGWERSEGEEKSWRGKQPRQNLHSPFSSPLLLFFFNHVNMFNKVVAAEHFGFFVVLCNLTELLDGRCLLMVFNQMCLIKYLLQDIVTSFSFFSKYEVSP